MDGNGGACGAAEKTPRNPLRRAAEESFLIWDLIWDLFRRTDFAFTFGHFFQGFFT